MTPDLMEEGAQRHKVLKGRTESGGRDAGFARPVQDREVDVSHGRILYLEDVSVSFDGFKAINKLSLDIVPGELRCIIGPNGAGKTTMMDIITGKTRPDEGTVFFGSTIDLLRHKEADIAQMGIGRKFQKPTVFEQLTVFENLELALKTNKGVGASVFFRMDGEQDDRPHDRRNQAVGVGHEDEIERVRGRDSRHDPHPLHAEQHERRPHHVEPLHGEEQHPEREGRVDLLRGEAHAVMADEHGRPPRRCAPLGRAAEITVRARPRPRCSARCGCRRSRRLARSRRAGRRT